MKAEKAKPEIKLETCHSICTIELAAACFALVKKADVTRTSPNLEISTTASAEKLIPNHKTNKSKKEFRMKTSQVSSYDKCVFIIGV